MSQCEKFPVAVVACFLFRAVLLISLKPDWIGACSIGFEVVPGITAAMAAAGGQRMDLDSTDIQYLIR